MRRFKHTHTLVVSEWLVCAYLVGCVRGEYIIDAFIHAAHHKQRVHHTHTSNTTHTFDFELHEFIVMLRLGALYFMQQQ